MTMQVRSYWFVLFSLHVFPFLCFMILALIWKYKMLRKKYPTVDCSVYYSRSYLKIKLLNKFWFKKLQNTECIRTQSFGSFWCYFGVRKGVDEWMATKYFFNHLMQKKEKYIRERTYMSNKVMIQVWNSKYRSRNGESKMMLSICLSICRWKFGSIDKLINYFYFCSVGMLW